MDDSLTQYRSTLDHPLLDPAEEGRLLNRASRGDRRAISAVVSANQRLVMSVALRYYHSGMAGSLDLMDLVQYGNLGLLEAITRFDAGRGYRFSTYATYWIRAYVRRAGLMHGHSSTRSAREGELVFRISQARSVLHNRLRRTPTCSEIAAHAGISQALVEEIVPMIPAALSLDQSDPGDERTIGDCIPSEDDTAEVAEQRIDLQSLRRHLGSLPPLYGRVITLRYGLDGGEPITYTAIAERLGVSRTRVQVVERSALRRLRIAMGAGDE